MRVKAHKLSLRNKNEILQAAITGPNQGQQVRMGSCFSFRMTSCDNYKIFKQSIRLK